MPTLYELHVFDPIHQPKGATLQHLSPHLNTPTTKQILLAEQKNVYVSRSSKLNQLCPLTQVLKRIHNSINYAILTHFGEPSLIKLDTRQTQLKAYPSL